MKISFIPTRKSLLTGKTAVFEMIYKAFRNKIKKTNILYLMHSLKD